MFVKNKSTKAGRLFNYIPRDVLFIFHFTPGLLHDTFLQLFLLFVLPLFLPLCFKSIKWQRLSPPPLDFLGFFLFFPPSSLRATFCHFLLNPNWISFSETL